MDGVSRRAGGQEGSQNERPSWGRQGVCDTNTQSSKRNFRMRDRWAVGSAKEWTTLSHIEHGMAAP